MLVRQHNFLKISLKTKPMTKVEKAVKESEVAGELNHDSNYPSAAQIKEWKAKHGVLKQITVDNKFMILRTPQLIDLERAQVADKDGKKPYNFHRSIISNCALYQTEGMMADDATARAVFGQLDELIVKKEAEVKEL
jgi:myo-inositol-hexaphosphate 3-phosphohydrolase